jgi:uncharacterized ferritin-like protein (DUF455 family)
MAMNWSPFFVNEDPSVHADPPRFIHSKDGIGDRLRAAAFAEIQAREAFLWAAETFIDAPADLRGAWRNLAAAENRHLGWLLARMEQLALDVGARKVSDHLWHSLIACKTAQEFAIYMANAEERGRKAGERFYQALLDTDPISAGIFGKIAAEEIEHIALAERFFPDAWKVEGMGPDGPGTSAKFLASTLERPAPKFKPL